MACADPRLRATVAVLLLLLAACGGPDRTPEQQVREVIAGLETAVEDRSLKTAAALLHADYADEWHPDRRAATRSLFGYLRRHQHIHLFTLTRSVTVAPGASAAQAVVYVAMTGVPVTSVEALVSLKADLYRFDVGLLTGDEGWQVREARWKRVGTEELGLE